MSIKDLEEIFIDESYFTLQPQINEVIIKYNNETHEFSKLHRLIDLIEVIIKTNSAFIISNYIHINKVSPVVKKLLAKKLITPSLGHWQGINRIIVDELVICNFLTYDEFNSIIIDIQKNKGNNNSKPFIDLLNEMYTRDEIGYKLINNITKKHKSKILDLFKLINYKYSPEFIAEDFYNDFYKFDTIIDEYKLISFRNKYAHGATATGEVCIEDIKRYLPSVKKMLSIRWLNNIGLIVKNQNRLQCLVKDKKSKDFYCSINNIDNEKIEESIPYFINKKGKKIICFPIIHMDDNLLFFLNDCIKVKKGKLSLLNYPKALHLTNNVDLNKLNNYINFNEWSKIQVDLFEERLDFLTEDFFGRKVELEELDDYIIRNNEGIKFIFGKPGIGKSALLAQLIKNIKGNFENKFKDIYLIKYFIRRNTITSNPIFFLNYMIEELEKILKYNEGKKKDSIDEKHEYLNKLFSIASKSLDNKKKIIFIIDGLDEGIESNLLEYMPTQEYNKINIIYSSRKYAEVERFKKDINKLYIKQDMNLKKLSDEDIKGILYKSTNKYMLINNNHIVECISRRSQGEPLYLKLLIDAVLSNEINLENIDTIPKSINDMFEDIINIIKKQENRNNILNALLILVVAKDYILENQLLKILNKLNASNNIAKVQIADILNILEYLSDVLKEDEINNGSYQLFHEEFRVYLSERFTEQLKDIELAIIDYCGEWRLFMDNEKEMLYPINNYQNHLINQNLIEELKELIFDKQFIEAQVKITKDYATSFDMLYKIRKFFNSNNNYGYLNDSIIKISFRALDLYKIIDKEKKSIFEDIKTCNINKIETYVERIKWFEDDKKIIFIIILLSKIVEDNNDNTEILNKIYSLIEVYKLKSAPEEIIINICLSLKIRGYDYNKLIEYFNPLENIKFFPKELIKNNVQQLVVEYIKFNRKSYRIDNTILQFTKSVLLYGKFDEVIEWLEFLKLNKLLKYDLINTIIDIGNKEQIISSNIRSIIFNYIDNTKDYFSFSKIAYKYLEYLVDVTNKDEVDRFLKKIEEYNINEDLYVEIIILLLKKGYELQAIQLIDKIDSFESYESFELVEYLFENNLINIIEKIINKSIQLLNIVDPNYIASCLNLAYLNKKISNTDCEKKYFEIAYDSIRRKKKSKNLYKNYDSMIKYLSNKEYDKYKAYLPKIDDILIARENNNLISSFDVEVNLANIYIINKEEEKLKKLIMTISKLKKDYPLPYILDIYISIKDDTFRNKIRAELIKIIDKGANKLLNDIEELEDIIPNLIEVDEELAKIIIDELSKGCFERETLLYAMNGYINIGCYRSAYDYFLRLIDYDIDIDNRFINLIEKGSVEQLIYFIKGIINKENQEIAISYILEVMISKEQYVLLNEFIEGLGNIRIGEKNIKLITSILCYISGIQEGFKGYLNYSYEELSREENFSECKNNYFGMEERNAIRCEERINESYAHTFEYPWMANYAISYHYKQKKDFASAIFYWKKIPSDLAHYGYNYDERCIYILDLKNQLFKDIIVNASKYNYDGIVDFIKYNFKFDNNLEKKDIEVLTICIKYLMINERENEISEIEKIIGNKSEYKKEYKQEIKKFKCLIDKYKESIDLIEIEEKQSRINKINIENVEFSESIDYDIENLLITGKINEAFNIVTSIKSENRNPITFQILLKYLLINEYNKLIIQLIEKIKDLDEFAIDYIIDMSLMYVNINTLESMMSLLLSVNRLEKIGYTLVRVAESENDFVRYFSNISLGYKETLIGVYALGCYIGGFGKTNTKLFEECIKYINFDSIIKNIIDERVKVANETSKRYDIKNLDEWIDNIDFDKQKEIIFKQYQFSKGKCTDEEFEEFINTLLD